MKRCAYCGEWYKPKPHAGHSKYCSVWCREQATRKVYRSRHNPVERSANEGDWRCVDCHKPSLTYRCPSCKKRWLEKHGYTVNEVKSAMEDE